MLTDIIFMFSGQGSQYFQMGKSLYQTNSIFKKTFDEANDIVSNELNISLFNIIYANNKLKSDIFENTLYTHPALFIVQYALAQMLISEGIVPTQVLGTSLGELVASVIAGAIDWKDALKITLHQALLLQQYCQTGGMLSVLADIELYELQPALHRNLELAADNFPGHFILSGHHNNINETNQWLKQNSLISEKINVTHGFHSSLIDTVQNEIIRYQSQYNYSEMNIPLISCALAKVITNIDAQHFWKSIRNPILFRQTINSVKQLNSICFIDVGPSGTLANFVKYNFKSNNHLNIVTSVSPFGNNEENIIPRIKTTIDKMNLAH